MQYEHYLDPLGKFRELMTEIEGQARLKVIMRDNQTGATTGFWEFENTFELGIFADTALESTRGMPAGPFDQRMAWVRAKYTAEELIDATKQREE